jgi:hypothetical protein
MKVYLTDEKRKYNDWSDIFEWVSSNCGGIYGFHVQDVSDHSLTCDEILVIDFADELDAMMFKLRWGDT